MTGAELKTLLEALLLASDRPLGVDALLRLLAAREAAVARADVQQALNALQADCAGRAVELRQVAGGYRYQIRAEYGPWVASLWQEKPQKYSRALLETLALIAYRQPVTRAEIEDVRGVSVSSHILKTLQERGWIQVIGHKELPGRPALYGTTREFLDYFNLRSLDDLPPLQALADLDAVLPSLDLEGDSAPAPEAPPAEPDGGTA